MTRRLALSITICIALLGTTAPRAFAIDGFQSPSRNIGCVISAASVRCDIGQKQWSPPPKPADCPVDWGYGISLGRRGSAELICAGDSARMIGPVLPYGDSVRRGRIKCWSGFEGVRCVNLRNRHGFFLSRQRYRLF